MGRCGKAAGSHREHGEIRALLDLYQADYLIATGKLDEAENRLADAVSAVLRVRNNYIRSMKSAMQMRLLSVQMRLGHLEEALRTARSLTEEVCMLGYSRLVQDTVHWFSSNH